ncbi:MAG TPA: ATP-binding cassette domain-containing protein [Gaiellaceae bacterium]|nr:ATP-binding cassette domain-containing protein [Gaiellaceae bacterium]
MTRERALSITTEAPLAAGDPGQPLVSVRRVTKAFGAIRALSDVDLDVYAGEVVALLGDNGAGKSTLAKILAGAHPADSGEIRVGGRPVSISSPSEAQALGIAIVYQDLALCENLDTVANLFLGREEGRFLLSEESMEKHARSLLLRLSAKIPSVGTAVASLSGGQRQVVAIARSLLGNPSLVILDEPTAALGVAQTAEVLNMITQLSESGHGVVLITHQLADVQVVADRVVVLRQGRNNGTFRMSEVSQEDIIAAITGANNAGAAGRTGPSQQSSKGSP